MRQELPHLQAERPLYIPNRRRQAICKCWAEANLCTLCSLAPAVRILTPRIEVGRGDANREGKCLSK